MLAVMESAGLSEFFDGGYSSGPISPALSYFGAYDAHWVSRAVDDLRSKLGAGRTTADARAALLGLRSHNAGPRQFVKFSQHHVDTGRVWKPFVLVYGLSDGSHTPLLGRVLFDMAQRAASNEGFPARFFTDNLIGLNVPEQANRGGEQHWSPTVMVGLMNLVVDLLEARVMERRPMPDFMESN